MNLISEKDDIKFLIDTKFDFKYLSPIQMYVQWKLDNNKWDDYNELYHASKLIESLKTQKNIWFDTHLLMKNDLIIGVMFIVGGEIKKLEKKYNIENEEQSLLLKYFHIIEKGRGFGSLWLKSVIIPFYKEKKYQQIYIYSSHKDSFPFYMRLGNFISEYEQQSDNNLNKRVGNCFLIRI